MNRGDVWRWAVIVALTSAFAASAACRSTCPAASPATPASASASAGAALPVCGVLLDRSSDDDPDHTAFLVPVAHEGPKVRRYDVVNQTRHPAPLTVYAGWWLCVTEGRITAEPGEDYWELGTIQIAAFTIDQSNAERGQE